jgi:HEAT repeat protein
VAPDQTSQPAPSKPAFWTPGFVPQCGTSDFGFRVSGCPRSHGDRLVLWRPLALALALASALWATPALCAENQRDLIAVLQSQAAPGDKAIACKKLAIYGTGEAVPALAPLLADAELASWARIALEAIPGPAPDDALRQALGQLQGRLLVGTINSIGVRRDAKAVPGLVAKLNDAEPDVASAAAVALGHIGGDAAAAALAKALAKAPDQARADVAEGCILCAEKFLGRGQAAAAVKLYDTVRQSKAPRQKLLEATRGAILARQERGLPLLLMELRSPDKAHFGLGLRVARELPGVNVTRALKNELARAVPERQTYLLLALGDRTDAEALPAVLDALKSESKQLRLTAVGILDRANNPATASALLEAAASDADLTAPALTALARMPGNEVDADVLARLPQATGKLRQALIELAGQRRIERAAPIVARYTEDADPATRGAAVHALGLLGGDSQVADLARLLARTTGQKERDELEAALLAISGRNGAGSVPHLLPLARNADASLRIIALRALAAAGGPDALAAVKTALDDRQESVQDEAARTLSTWPNTWPEDERVLDPLLALARSGKKTSHQVLAVRGCLQFLGGDKKLGNEMKLARLKELLPSISRPEEKRQAITVLQGLRTAEALEMLASFAAQSAVAEEASVAILDLAGKAAPGLSKEQRQKALEAAATNAKKEATKKKAQAALDELK